MYRIIILIALCIFLTGCTQEVQNFYGEYTDVQVCNNTCAYQKSYLMMDCCAEWNDFCEYALDIPNVLAIEGYEYYLYDSDGNEVISDDIKNVTFRPTEEFIDLIEQKSSGHYEVYSFDYKEKIECYVTEDGYPAISTDKQGIFILAYVRDDDTSTYNNLDTTIYISNKTCDGQCRTCE